MRALVLVATVALAAAGCRSASASSRELRVCADPNNLPFSNDKGEGFENALAELLARDLHAKLVYTYWPQRRGFVRNTLGARTCDVIVGVPKGFDPVLTTKPYYRSSYVFVAREAIRSFDDPRLRTLRIGVPLVSDDGANPPPVHALARRGIVDNVQGFNVVGDYRKDSPPLDLLRALERGEIDVAIAWGPLAGAWAKKHPGFVLEKTPHEDGGLRMSFAIAMGVRRSDAALRDELDAFLARREAEVNALLDAHGVPR